MFPYPLGVTTLLQGLYSLVWIVFLMDVLSPTFDLRELSTWTGTQAALLIGGLFVTAFAVGVAMHTLSRNLFRKLSDQWDVQVVASEGIRARMAEFGACQPLGGPCLAEVHAAEGDEQVRKVGEFMQALDVALQLRAPQIHASAQVYRDQYRLARAFIVPSLILAFVIPFWEPLPVGHVGSFPLIGLQVFFLGVFFAGACMYAFRERSYRYTLARLRGFWSLESNNRSDSEAQEPAPSRRAEGKTNLAAIHKAQEAYFAEYGVYVSANPIPTSAAGSAAQTWGLDPAEAHGFNRIGYAPEGKLYFQYGVTSSGGAALTLAARSDLDGDGQFNAWGYYVKPETGSSSGVPGRFGVCPATGVQDPSGRAPNQLGLLGPCDSGSGTSVY